MSPNDKNSSKRNGVEFKKPKQKPLNKFMNILIH